MSPKRIVDFVLGVPLLWLLALFSGRKEKPSTPIKRILVIKLAAVGDTVLLIPILRSLRKVHPDAAMHWLVSPINQLIAATVPYVDRLWIWPGWSAVGLWNLLRNLHRQKFDVVVDWEQWARGTALLSFFTGAPVRLGFDTPGQHRAALHTRVYKKKFDRHEIDDFYELLSLLGPIKKNTTLELPVTEQGKKELVEHASFFAAHENKQLNVLIHPGCGADGFPREWPLGQYAVLAHWMFKKYSARIVLSAGPEEICKTQNLQRLLDGKAYDVGGRLSWLGLVALVSEMDLVISGNTGVMHVAAALGKKQVALHGPTDPKIWGPLNPHAAIVKSNCPQCPCLKLGFEYHAFDQSCMRRIDVDTVKAAISALIDNKKGI